MANIPVERTSSPFPWWILIIGLIVLAGGAYIAGDLIFDDDDDSILHDDVETVAVAPVAPVPVIAPADARQDGATLTSVDRIIAAPLSVVGAKVAIPNLHVTDVVGDKTFYVTAKDTSSDHRFFVLLNEQATPDHPGVEGRYDVNAGQVVTLYGTVERLNDSDRSKWNITEAEAERMGDDAVYLHAERLDITEQQLDVVEVD